MAGCNRRGGNLLLGAALALALGACSDNEAAEPDASDARSTSGEVLDGTISDEMIPLDELRSQAPQIEILPAASGERAEADDGGDGSGEDAADTSDEAGGATDRDGQATPAAREDQ